MAYRSKKNENKAKPDKTALETAVAYLATRMRTTTEVERHLAEKGYRRDEIQDAVNELIGRRYLDDYMYALRYFEYNREKKRGSLRAVRELGEKGLDSETIRNAREDFLYENRVDEFQDAVDFAVKELALRNTGAYGDEGFGEFTDKLAASIARKLETKGFSRDVIFKVLDRLRSMERVELS